MVSRTKPGCYLSLVSPPVAYWSNVRIFSALLQDQFRDDTHPLPSQSGYTAGAPPSSVMNSRRFTHHWSASQLKPRQALVRSGGWQPWRVLPRTKTSAPRAFGPVAFRHGLPVMDEGRRALLKRRLHLVQARVGALLVLAGRACDPDATDHVVAELDRHAAVERRDVR